MSVDPTLFWTAYAISNVIALVMVYASLKSPRLGRILFFLLFAWASVTNWTLALTRPDAYMEYANYAIPMYRDFIRGWFSGHIAILVVGIAAGQALIAVGMLCKGWILKGAALGAIVFLIAIAPLGFSAAFPFSVVTSCAAWLIFTSSAQEALVSFKGRGTSMRKSS